MKSLPVSMAAKSIRYIWLLVLVLLSSGSCEQEESGCTDVHANNYDPAATTNDGSCTYDYLSLTPLRSVPLGPEVASTSGLIYWYSTLWTCNDSGDPDLYGLDTATAAILGVISLGPESGTDREDMAQDEDYFYIGDFGNNSSGDRRDLHVLRYAKSDLKNPSPVPDTIWFSYSDQPDLQPSPANQTDFDCEAMIVRGDRIYLFTKQWVSNATTLYSLSKVPGRHVAASVSSFDAKGLITGADHWISEQRVVLCGYNSLLQPFIVLLYDFKENRFFEGNRRRIELNLPFHQVEGIAVAGGYKLFLTNEAFNLQGITSTGPFLHTLDLSAVLSGEGN